MRQLLDFFWVIKNLVVGTGGIDTVHSVIFMVNRTLNVAKISVELYHTMKALPSPSIFTEPVRHCLPMIMKETHR